jgi:hypothetical protein
MTERSKLTILEVKDPRPVGQAELLPFIAAGPDQKALQYGCWTKTLYEYIKKGAVIDADIETKVSDKVDPNGVNYVSRRVVQLYADGGTVLKKQLIGRSYGKTPEERLSIEAQTAIKAITDLEVAGKTVRPELIALRDNWLKRALTASAC